MKPLLGLMMVLATVAAGAADETASDRWGRVRFMLGTWEGTASGEPGEGTVERTYEREGKVRGYALIAGDARIGIGQDDGAKGWDRIKGQGCSLQITTDQPVDDIAGRIKAKGGTLLSEPEDMHWGVRMFQVLDPDGFKLGVSKPLGAS